MLTTGDYIQLASAIATVITLVFILIQIRLQTKATEDQLKATQSQVEALRNQIYTSFVEDCLQLDQMMIQYPECRKFNFDRGEKKLIADIDDETLRCRVLSMEEFIIDSMENVCTYLPQIPPDQCETWIDYIEAMRDAPAFKYYTQDYRPSWYANSNAVKMDLKEARKRLVDDRRPKTNSDNRSDRNLLAM